MTVVDNPSQAAEQQNGDQAPRVAIALPPIPVDPHGPCDFIYFDAERNRCRVTMDAVLHGVFSYSRRDQCQLTSKRDSFSVTATISFANNIPHFVVNCHLQVWPIIRWELTVHSLIGGQRQSYPIKQNKIIQEGGRYVADALTIPLDVNSPTTTVTMSNLFFAQATSRRLVRRRPQESASVYVDLIAIMPGGRDAHVATHKVPYDQYFSIRD